MELKQTLELISHFERGYCDTTGDGPTIKVIPFVSNIKLDENDNRVELEELLDPIDIINGNVLTQYAVDTFRGTTNPQFVQDNFVYITTRQNILPQDLDGKNLSVRIYNGEELVNSFNIYSLRFLWKGINFCNNSYKDETYSGISYNLLLSGHKFEE